jgi:hypothetical protein
MLNALTIDVEDYYHVSAFEAVVPFADWGYPPKAGHFVSSITYREGLMALSGQGQLIDLR